MTTANLDAEARRIRVELVGCPRQCEGVVRRNPGSGHVPRLVHLERRGMRSDDGVVIVGMNPGAAGDDESNIVRDSAKEHDEAAAEEINGRIATALYAHFEKNILPENRYYKLAREAVSALGFSGPIFWTEAVKCSSTSRGSLSVTATTATFATCGSIWLRRELEFVPTAWPLITVGRDAFVAACLLATDRRILGLPHVTAARSPAFWRVFQRLERDGDLRLRRPANKALVAWLTGAQRHFMLFAAAPKESRNDRPRAQRPNACR